MKSKLSLIVMICLLIGGSANAQFFKKLKKKAENAAERTILNRTDREVSKGTDKSIDNAMEGGNKDKKTKESDDSSEAESAKANNRALSVFGGDMAGIPESYKFQYIMDMTMTSGKNEMLIKYYVQPKAGYFGFTMANDMASDSFVVYDMENEAMVSFMDTNGQKMAMRMKIPFDEKMQETIEKGNSGKNESITDANITPIKGKTILGYRCKGYQIKQEDGISKFYITDEAPVSFVGMFASMKKMQKKMDTTNIPFDENSMMMEMEYIPNKKREDKVHMICTAIKEQPYIITKADYKQM